MEISEGKRVFTYFNDFLYNYKFLNECVHTKGVIHMLHKSSEDNIQLHMTLKDPSETVLHVKADYNDMKEYTNDMKEYTNDMKEYTNEVFQNVKVGDTIEVTIWNNGGKFECTNISLQRN